MVQAVRTCQGGFSSVSKTDSMARTLANEDGATVAEQKSAEKLTREFLRALKKHLVYSLEQKLGASILRTTPLEFCLTVPAIWSEAAKEKTLAACRNAGFDNSDTDILLVSEPVSNINGENMYRLRLTI